MFRFFRIYPFIQCVLFSKVLYSDDTVCTNTIILAHTEVEKNRKKGNGKSTTIAFKHIKQA